MSTSDPSICGILLEFSEVFGSHTGGRIREKLMAVIRVHDLMGKVIVFYVVALCYAPIFAYVPTFCLRLLP